MSIEEKFALIQQKEEKRALGAETLRGLVPGELQADEPKTDAKDILRSESERKDVLIAELHERMEDAAVLRRHLKAVQETTTEQEATIATLRREAADKDAALRAVELRNKELETTNALQRDRIDAVNEVVVSLQRRLGQSDALIVELQQVIKGYEDKEVFEWPQESKLSPELRKEIVKFLEKGDMGGLENLLDRLIRYDDKLHTLLKHTYFKEKVEELYGRYFRRNQGPVRRGTDTAPGIPLSGTNGGTTLGFGPNARTLGVLFIDLDNFKLINDKMGHDTGDVALKEVAAVLNETLRAADIKGRFGGEELEAAIELENPADGQKVARKLVEAIAALKIKHEKFEFGVTASVGVAELQPGEDLDGLISRANWAMKYAKHMGKNRFIPAELDTAMSWVEQAKQEEANKEKGTDGPASR